MAQPDFPPYLHGAYSKMDVYAARLALVMHLLHAACSDRVSDGTIVQASDRVDEQSILAGWVLADYFKGHARKAHRLIGRTPEDRTIDTVYLWLKSHGGQGTLRDLIRARVAGIRENEPGLSLFRLMERRGYGRIEEEAVRGGRRFTFILTSAGHQGGPGED